MKHGSLFSGIGGFDLASEWMGWENVFHCEWNEFGQKILKYYWPNAISYGDITKTDFTIWRGRIDILTGGFPCQPYSMAGKRKGKEDERHLWPEMLRAIREIQPCWVVGENVPGIINWSGGLVFHEVQTDLEAEGYEVFPVVLPACGVNAPHRRDRVWFVAHSVNGGYRNKRGGNRKKNSIQGKDKQTLCSGMFDRAVAGFTPNTTSDAITGQNREGTEIEGTGITVNEQIGGRQQSSIQYKGLDDLSRSTPDTGNQRLQKRISGRFKSISNQAETFKGCQFTRTYSANQWDKFPTVSPLCGRDDGISSQLDGITFSKWRNESIKAYGNAIVPQVAYQIFKAIDNC